MTDGLDIPKDNHGLVWVFKVDLPESEAIAFNTETFVDDTDVEWPMHDALGVKHLDHDFTELFDAAVLKEHGLTKYLSDANGIDDDKLAADREKLDTLEGMLFLVFSSAVPEGVEAFTPQHPVSFIGRYGGDVEIRPFDALPKIDADAILAAPKPSGEKTGGSRLASITVAIIAILTLALVYFFMNQGVF